MKRQGKGWTALCPAHDDHNASLSIHEGDDSSLLIKCHAGCSFDKVAAATGLEVGDFFQRASSVSIKGVNGSRDIAATYDYRDADGRLVFQVVRFKPKDFRQRRPDASKPDGWVWNLAGVQRVLYRVHELLSSDPDAWIFVVEGERDVDRLRELGLVATCNSGGAGKWQPEYAKHFHSRRVVIIADNDEPGRRHAQAIAASLQGIAEHRIVELPGLPEHGDVSDWLDAGHALDELLALVDAPAPAPAETADLLDLVRDYVARYVLLPSPHYLDVIALWVLHTHVVGAADTTPRLMFKSAEKESGKTRALEVLDQLVAAPLSVMNATIAAIFRTLADGPATILFDEVDALFGAKAAREHEDLRALLNAGYRRGAGVVRVVSEGAKMHAQKFPVFAAAALAAIGDLPDTIESRSIVVPMRRRAPGERLDPFRLREASARSEVLRHALQAWGPAAEERLGTSIPEMPEGVTDRAADCWEPLIAIADLAGREWPARARAAATFVVAGRLAEDSSLGVRLLADIKTVMDGHDRMASAAMAAKLNAIDEAGWGGWHAGTGMTQRDVAHRLKPYEIRPRVIRLDDGSTPRGYQRHDFVDAWTRYLRESPSTSATIATSATPIRIHVADVADVADIEEITTRLVRTDIAPVDHVAQERGKDGGADASNGSAPPADDLAAEQLDRIYGDAVLVGGDAWREEARSS